jgi:hypothetical protein
MEFLKVHCLVLCFLSYTSTNIYDLPATINLQSQPALFADDTTIITSHPHTDYFQNCMNDAFASLNKWFKAN